MNIKRILLIAFVIIGYSFTVLSIPLTKFFAYFDGRSGNWYSDIGYYLSHFPLNCFIIINLSVAVLAGIFLYIDLSDERDRKKKENNEQGDNENKSDEYTLCQIYFNYTEKCRLILSRHFIFLFIFFGCFVIPFCYFLTSLFHYFIFFVNNCAHVG